MSFTIPGPAIALEDTTEDFAGKEGYCALISSAGVALADGTEEESALVCGVVVSVNGIKSEGTQQAAVQISGAAYAVSGAAFAVGDWLMPDGSAKWIVATTGKFPKGQALQAASAADQLVQIAVIGSTSDAV